MAKFSYARLTVKILKSKRNDTQNDLKQKPADLDRFRSKRRKWWLWAVAAVIVALIAWYVTTILVAVNRVTGPKADGTPTYDLKKLTEEQLSPINILLLGVGGDKHPGGSLADSIMVASIDIKSSTISLVSLPRDLYVSIPGRGKDKINASTTVGKTKNEGAETLKKVVSETLGVPLHYYVRIDFEGFRKVVDALGGVTVDVKNPLNDPMFPNATLTGYEPFKLAAGKQTLDGNTALKYARSRHSSGSEGSDFARARRQQEILSAVKDKVLSAQVLANPKKVTSIISIVGQHVLSDFSAGEIEQLISLGRSMDNPTIRSFVFDTSEKGLLASGTASNGAYILVPRAGANDYSQIQAFTQAFFAAPRIGLEKPAIQVNRGLATKAQYDRVIRDLETAGFTLAANTATASPTPVPAKQVTTLIDLSDSKKPASSKYLKEQYHLAPKTETRKSAESPDYILTLGGDIAKIMKTIGPINPTPTDGHKALQPAFEGSKEDNGSQGMVGR